MHLHTTIIEFGTPAFAELIKLRDLVLRKPLGLEFSVEDINKEYRQIHLGCYNQSNQLLGVLVLNPLSDDQVKMRQVAVNPDFHGKGIGSFMVESSEVIAKAHNFKEIVLSARLPAVKFYQRLDYITIGDVYQEVGIDHKKMKKVL